MRLKKLFKRWLQKDAVKRVSIRDYPYNPRARPIEQTTGGRLIQDLFERSRFHFDELCEEMKKDQAFFGTFLQRKSPSDLRTPIWINGWMPPLDGMLLYTLARLNKPKTYLEIGSGNSTKFVRRAIEDHGLATRIVSIDPYPRAEIDGLCDEVIRQPFEDVGASVMPYLQPGDILFQDSSHRSFMNSDTTIFFTEILPDLPHGVVVGMHDIFLPFDYPEIWKNRWYNEQYLLMMFLLGGARSVDLVFPAYFAAQDRALSARMAELYTIPALQESQPHGSAFWMRTVARNSSSSGH